VVWEPFGLEKKGEFASFPGVSFKSLKKGEVLQGEGDFPLVKVNPVEFVVKVEMNVAGFLSQGQQVRVQLPAVNRVNALRGSKTKTEKRHDFKKYFSKRQKKGRGRCTSPWSP